MFASKLLKNIIDDKISDQRKIRRTDTLRGMFNQVNELFKEWFKLP